MGYGLLPGGCWLTGTGRQGHGLGRELLPSLDSGRQGPSRGDAIGKLPLEMVLEDWKATAKTQGMPGDAAALCVSPCLCEAKVQAPNSTIMGQ